MSEVGRAFIFAIVFRKWRVFVGGVGDGIFAEHHYDFDAAANARNTSFPLAPAGESEVHYSRVNFGGDCCSRLRTVFRTSFLFFSDREIIVVYSHLRAGV